MVDTADPPPAGPVPPRPVADRPDPHEPVAADDQVMVIDCDAAGTIVAVTGPLGEWFGYDLIEVVGQPIVPFMHPRNQEVSASLITTMAGKPHLDLTEELGSWVPTANGGGQHRPWPGRSA